MGFTASDHFHPGSSVARPTLLPAISTRSTLPLSKVRVSSAASKLLAWFGMPASLEWRVAGLARRLSERARSTHVRLADRRGRPSSARERLTNLLGLRQLDHCFSVGHEHERPLPIAFLKGSRDTDS